MHNTKNSNMFAPTMLSFADLGAASGGVEVPGDTANDKKERAHREHESNQPKPGHSRNDFTKDWMRNGGATREEADRYWDSYVKEAVNKGDWRMEDVHT